MTSKKRVTIKDVARVAGVSTQTVSRVINNRPNVSAETRLQVQEVISQLGYAPNIIARSLSRGRSDTLGVVGFGLEYYGSSSVLTGIEEKSSELGFSVLLSLMDNSQPERVDEILRELLSHQVEGIIWAIPGIGDALKGLPEKFERISVPVVFLNKDKVDSDTVVAMDNRSGGKLATKHLLEQGYKKVATITGPSNWWEARQRELGWREAMREAGFDNLDELCMEGDWNAPSGEVKFHSLYAQFPDIDAVFVGNDQMALGVLKAARRLGLRIPEDLGVIGFDDIPEAAYFYPSLSTVHQDVRALGAMAVEKLCDLIQNPKHVQNVDQERTWIKPRLIVRKSSVRDS